MTTNQTLIIQLNALFGAPAGERLAFERTVPAPNLQDLPNLEALTVSGHVEALEDRWLVVGSAKVSMELVCARCLRAFRRTIGADFSEEFSRRPTEDQFLSEPTRLDLAYMLRAVLVLAVPDRPLHDPDCKGLCDVCGKDLNIEPHFHKTPKAQSPFAKLRNRHKSS